MSALPTTGAVTFLRGMASGKWVDTHIIRIEELQELISRLSLGQRTYTVNYNMFKRHTNSWNRTQRSRRNLLVRFPGKLEGVASPAEMRHIHLQPWPEEVPEDTILGFCYAKMARPDAHVLKLKKTCL